MFEKYIEEIDRLYRSGHATEHSYRPALQDCLSRLLKDVQVTNEPKRQKCGAPDYILTRRKIDVGYIEAKDVGVDLDRVERGGKDDDQWKRYSTSLDNIILTDYLEFRFFLNGQKVETIRLAEPDGRSIVAKPENFDRFQNLIIDFAAFQGQTIKSAKKLAEMMARKAALMRDVFFQAVSSDVEGENGLKGQLEAFKAVLMHDMEETQFADVYAQTIAYGLFTARLHDETLADFSRAEALTLIPKSNPFLRQLFHYVAGPDLDDRVIWIVDALCEVYRAADLRAILKDFGASTGKDDPILHFYETFLAFYDPSLREKRGVYYTPEPVVRFIVRAVDECLKTHFGMKDGLADTSMVEIEIENGFDKKGKKTYHKRQVHKLQMLDVAAGTGTFLAEIIKQIHARFQGQQGIWSSYIEQHLLPRIHGFELLMAPYAMCHMKLDLLLKETGYVPSNPANPPRLGVYLTNSLEEHHPDTGTLFAQWLSREANEASRIKKDMPIMVALGNPPYSGISSNMGSWIAQNKIEDYKYVNGVHFNERKHWLNDDYVQFIRLGEHYIEKNGEGILAYITNHGYLDNPTFRGMRWHLLNTFDDIYVLDLHGNSKKKEVAPDGSPDKNVFDIQQGVAIIIAIKTRQKGKEKPLAKVHHAELWGAREEKYNFLANKSPDSCNYCNLCPREPTYQFIPKAFEHEQEYQKAFSINLLMPLRSTGIQTSRDDLVIDFDEGSLIKKISIFTDLNLNDTQVRQRFFQGKGSSKYPNGDTRHWKLDAARRIIQSFPHQDCIANLNYRPFDVRKYYDHEAMIDWPRKKVMQHFLHQNIALLIPRQLAGLDYYHSFCSKNPCEMCVISTKTKEQNYVFPLYLYEDVLDGIEAKHPNLDPKIYKAIQKIVPDVTPESLFDYIYAVLHSRAYRTRYAEFLKSDFPRIPYPKDKKPFHALADLGGKIRALHLMESPDLEKLVTTYPISGDHEVVKVRWEPNAKDKSKGKGRVWINPTQYFDNVPKIAWEFYIGGYQPAQKWLKDRGPKKGEKGRKLTSDDLLHWQRIIVALTETNCIMDAIDKISFLPDKEAAS